MYEFIHWWWESFSFLHWRFCTPWEVAEKIVWHLSCLPLIWISLGSARGNGNWAHSWLTSWICHAIQELNLKIRSVDNRPQIQGVRSGQEMEETTHEGSATREFWLKPLDLLAVPAEFQVAQSFYDGFQDHRISLFEDSHLWNILFHEKLVVTRRDGEYL